MRIAIVGAGPSGLAALRALRGAGFDAFAFERGTRIGGVWTLEDRPTAAYRSLHLITSRERTEFAELPMPDGHARLPAARRRSAATSRATPSASACASTSGWAPRCRARRGVATAAAGSSSWPTATRARPTCWWPPTATTRWPSGPTRPTPGEFAAASCTRSTTTTPTTFEGERVMVVGMGNSAMDIATDLSHVAERTLLSVRHGSWVIPKRLLGQPADQVVRPWAAVHVPWRLRQPLSQALLRVVVGPARALRAAGAGARPVPGPPHDHRHRSSAASATATITPKPGIERCAGDRCASPTAARSRSTRSSGAPATG